MPRLQIVGATIGDIHARHTKPSCRAEKDWYPVMERHFDSLTQILKRNGNPPLLYAGDIVDKWASPPELINFLIRVMPHGYAVAGNHDLPYHSYKDIKRSAYWTLVQAGKITNLKEGKQVFFGNLTVTGFPYGSVVVGPDVPPSHVPHVALIHHYVWQKGHTHPGALEADHVNVWVDRLHDYHGAIFGDNHQPFTVRPGVGVKLNWLRNGGAFMRQAITDMDNQPTVGLIWSDGSLTEEKIDCREDQFNDGGPGVEHGGNVSFAEVVAELSALEKHHQDYRSSVIRALNQEGVTPGVRKLVLEYLGEGK